VPLTENKGADPVTIAKDEEGDERELLPRRAFGGGFPEAKEATGAIRVEVGGRRRLVLREEGKGLGKGGLSRRRSAVPPHISCSSSSSSSKP
jgi:hypothetical protein